MGAANALEQILARQMLEAQQAAREREAQARLGMEQQRINESIKQNEIENTRTAKLDDERAADRRQRQNVAGVRRMIGDSLTQRSGPLSQDDMRGIAALQIEAGDSPNLSALAPPAPPKRTVVTTIGPRGKPMKKAFTDDELAEGVPEYEKPEKPTAGEHEPMVVTMPDGSIKDLNNILPPGAVPYDPVAARSSKPEDQREAQDTAREATRLASELLKHPGFGGAFGLARSHIPTMRQSTADAETLRDALTSLLTLENMGKMKGVLSDSDMKVLRQASSTLNARMGDAAAKKELQRIVAVMSKASGETTAETPTADTAGGDEIDAMIERLRKPKG